MCDLCMKHGAGGKWYLNAEHYSNSIVEKYNLRDFLMEQYRNFEQIPVRKVHGFNAVGLGYKLRIPIIGRIVKRTAEKMLHSTKPPTNPFKAEGHIGQVVPLEDAIAILESCAAEPIIEKNCMCRYMSRGIKDACCINFGVMSEIIDKLPEELSGGISWLYDVVRSVLSLLELRGEDLRSRDLSMEEYLAQAMEFRKSLGNGYAADLPGLAERGVRLFSGLREMLKTVLLGDAMKRLVVRSIESPDVLMKSLRESSEGLPAQLANIEETSAAYQTGKDELASERLKAFIDYIHRYIRMCHQIAPVFRIDPAGIQVGGLSLEQKNRGIQELLGRMLEALENNDIITLSDILEYELKPMLQDLGAYLDSLEKAVKAA